MNNNAHVITYLFETFRKKCESIRITKEGRYNKGQIIGPWLKALRQLREETGEKGTYIESEGKLGRIESAMLSARKIHKHQYYPSLEECLQRSRW